MSYQKCQFCDPESLNYQSIADNGITRVYQTHRPAVTPHVLIMPVRHIQFLEDMNGFESRDFPKTLRAVVRACTEVYGIRGYNLWVNGGTSAGQEVPHLHVHFFGHVPGGNASASSLMENYFKNPPTELDEEAISGLVHKLQLKLEAYLKE